MNLAPSSYYYTPKTKSLKQQKWEAEVKKRIEAICLEFPRYGYRRVTKQLHRDGYKINHKKVLRIMRENELLCRPKKKFVKTTNSDHNYPIHLNLINKISITRPNQVWVADITYIRIAMGFVYLAAILDAFSRKVIGYAVSRRLGMRVAINALIMALSQRKPGLGCIHHSDRGVQYAAGAYISLLQNYGFLISMSRKGNPYDNAIMESFFKTLKYDEVYLWEYETIYDVKKRIPYFIEQVYNQKRLHSSLGYLPPNEFEAISLRNLKPSTPCLISYPNLSN